MEHMRVGDGKIKAKQKALMERAREWLDGGKIKINESGINR